MRKVYVLGLFIISMASGAFAQRAIDWSLDEMVKPVQINSGSTTSTVEVETVLKLVSGDSAFMGDTVLMVMAINTNPPIQGAFFFVLQKNMGVGDTVHWNNTLTINGVVQNSGNVNFTLGTFIRNGAQISAEVAPGNANNVQSRAMVWYNQKGWGVSVSDVSADAIFTISPNPASDVVNIDWNVATTDGVYTTRVYDINGRLVLEHSASSTEFNQELNISSLEAGIYMVQVSNGEFTATKKLQVAR